MELGLRDELRDGLKGELKGELKDELRGNEKRRRQWCLNFLP
jgi:hypothetical protein